MLALMNNTITANVHILFLLQSNSFEYKETVPWSEVARVLTALFQHNTGRALTPEHLLYLAKMAFRKIDYVIASQHT